MASVQAQRLTFFEPIGRFAARFLEMCAAMCAGGVILSVAIFDGAALIGFPNLVQRYPEASMLIIGINLALAMGAWMAFRRHPWRHNLEMSATSIVAALLIIAAYEFGLVPSRSLAAWYTLFALQCGPSCLLMAADMVAHFGHYTGRAGHHAHAHAA